MSETAMINLGSFDWPHAPVHRLSAADAYIIMAGTYQKRLFFQGNNRLSYLTKALIALAAEHRLRLQDLHSISAKYVNRLTGSTKHPDAKCGINIRTRTFQT
jgi:hypothetical protein